MSARNEINVVPQTNEEKFFMMLPDCTCSACVQMYDVLKNSIDAKRFKKLDFLRLVKFSKPRR